MAPQKWILSLLTLTCILGVSLFMDYSPAIRTVIVGKLKQVAPDALGGWSDVVLTTTFTTPPVAHSKKQNGKLVQLAVGVNLTTCLPTFVRPGKPLINCCPARSMLEDPILDFQFPDPATTPTRVRRFAHRLDKEYVAKYERAVSIMRSLPYSDPRSFARQADIHCQYCTGSFLQQHSDLPLLVHKTWIFFPWHRMMLYFHERILGSLIGDDTFALPFWAWDLPEGMTLPEIYLNGSLNDDDQRDRAHYPPAVVDLGFRMAPRSAAPEDQTRLNLALMYNHMVSGARTAELFMGCAYKTGQEYEQCQGTIERAPHNTVHLWVGADMGAFYTAARDPSFYAHHSNIDRLWEVWRAAHPEVNDPEFLDSYMYFYDENLRLVRIRFRDVMDLDKLRYRYEDVDNVWLAAQPKPSVSPRLARREIRRRNVDHQGSISGRPDFVGLTGGGRVLGSTAMTTRVDRPRAVRIGRSRSRKGKEEQVVLEEILVVEGIDVKSSAADDGDYVKFDVYINVVNDTILSPMYREFVGTFVDISRGASMGKKTTLQLGISEALEDLKADRDEAIWVTLVPMTESCNQVTIDGLSIKYARHY